MPIPRFVKDNPLKSCFFKRNFKKIIGRKFHLKIYFIFSVFFLERKKRSTVFLVKKEIGDYTVVVFVGGGFDEINPTGDMDHLFYFLRRNV